MKQNSQLMVLCGEIAEVESSSPLSLVNNFQVVWHYLESDLVVLIVKGESPSKNLQNADPSDVLLLSFPLISSEAELD